MQNFPFVKFYFVRAKIQKYDENTKKSFRDIALRFSELENLKKCQLSLFANR